MSEKYLSLFLGLGLDVFFLLTSLSRLRFTAGRTLRRTWPGTTFTDPTSFWWPGSAATCWASTTFSWTGWARFTSCAILRRRRSPTLRPVTAVWPLSTFILAGSWVAPTTTASACGRSGTLKSGIPSSITATGSRPTIATKSASIRANSPPGGLLKTSVTRPWSSPVILSPAAMVMYDGPRITKFWRRFWRPPSTFISRWLFTSRLLITITITGRPFPRLTWTWTPVSGPSRFLSRRLRKVCCWFAENKLERIIFFNSHIDTVITAIFTST